MPQGVAQSNRFRRYVSGGHADGVLMVSFHASDALLKGLLETGVPTVLGGRPIADLEVSYVDADNIGGARAATAHLLARGKKVIGTITGPLDMAAGLDRLTGYREALRESGASADPTLEETGDFSQDSGARATDLLLARRPDIDAIFAASDVMAVGALQALERAGRRAGADVAVVGFDDSDAARLASPPLTTVRQPIEDMGRQMAAILLEHILEGTNSPRQVVLGTELVIRSSS